MSFLCILAAIASFVIETKTSISASGELPETATANYECTYKKGQLTDGNTATLYLSGWQNTYIHSVTLYMRSNKQSGAGSLNMTVDEQTVWKISNNEFSSSAWNGSFSDTYVPISHSFSPAITSSQGNITIQVAASANSLYIERYEIEWEQAEARPYTVGFVANGYGIAEKASEAAVGEGIELPLFPNISDWFFIGWSEVPVVETTSCPRLYMAGSRYFPSFDTRLYAVYTNYDSPNLRTTQCTEARSGYYALAFPITKNALNGCVEETMCGVPLTEVALQKNSEGRYERLFEILPSMVYSVDFLNDSIAHLWQAESGVGIGYKNGKVCAGISDWHYRILADSTFAFYVPQDSVRSRVLTAYYDSKNQCWLASCVSLANSSLKSQALLFEADYTDLPILYTSFPYGQGIPSVSTLPEVTGTNVVQMGIYRLYIMSNGKKILQYEAQ